MNFVSGASWRPAVRTSGRAALFGALFVLAACAGREPVTTGTAVLPALATAAQDPLGRFVATAAPGQQGMVALPNGRTVQVRLVRAYAAASRRECREVLLDEGIGGWASLLCQADGQWVAARPLLLGSGAVRP
jgi:hypothetical protein